jgi:tRNA G18 (ribose-2'-O)-methylase SpoU
VKLIDFLPGAKTALVVGNEVNGVDSQVLSLANKIVEIPMMGRKESFNVAVSTAIALYDLMQKTK